MVFITFFGEEKTNVHYKPGILILLPLIVLAILTTIGGFIQLPENLGNIKLFSSFIENTLPHTILKNVGYNEWIFQILSAIIALSGVYIAYIIFLKKPIFIYNRENKVQKFFLYGWNFDKLYNKLFVQPFVWIAKINRNDILDKIFDNFGLLFIRLSQLFGITQNGRLNWFLTGLMAGLILVITLMLYL
jgi:NADH-quinone oxidoreductase subunit L